MAKNDRNPDGNINVGYYPYPPPGPDPYPPHPGAKFCPYCGKKLKNGVCPKGCKNPLVISIGTVHDR